MNEFMNEYDDGEYRPGVTTDKWSIALMILLSPIYVTFWIVAIFLFAVIAVPIGIIGAAIEYLHETNL